MDPFIIAERIDFAIIGRNNNVKMRESLNYKAAAVLVSQLRMASDTCFRHCIAGFACLIELPIFQTTHFIFIGFEPRAFGCSRDVVTIFFNHGMWQAVIQFYNNFINIVYTRKNILILKFQMRMFFQTYLPNKAHSSHHILFIESFWFMHLSKICCCKKILMKGRVYMKLRLNNFFLKRKMSTQLFST